VDLVAHTQVVVVVLEVYLVLHLNPLLLIQHTHASLAQAVVVLKMVPQVLKVMTLGLAL
jgi:hypothetical protein